MKNTVFTPTDHSGKTHFQFRASRSYIILGLIACLGSMASLSAQTEEEENAIIELSPFVVDASLDRGYQATNTTAGTSLNTALRNLPMGIEIVTRDFLDDIQATDMREGLAFTPGVFMEQFEDQTSANQGTSRDYSPSQAVGASEFNDAVIIRGYTVPNQQRLGFRMGTIVPAYHISLGGITDGANTARQEVVRGPQSLLYGINVLSGVVNIVPLRPLAESRTSLNVSMGSEDFFRTVLDHTGPLQEGLNYRVVGSYQTNDDWIDFKDRERSYYLGQIDWRINQRANLLLEFQYSDTLVRGHGQQFYVDRGGLPNNRDFTNPYGQRFTYGRDFHDTLVSEDRRLLPRGQEGSDIGRAMGLESEGDRYVVPEGSPFLVQKPGQEYVFEDLGRFYNVSGPDTFRQRKEFNFIGLLNANPFKGFDVELGTMYAHVDDKERNVRMDIFENSQNTLLPSPLSNTTLNARAFHLNPEFDPNDPFGFGPGELFVYPDQRRDRPQEALFQRNYAYYYWYERPTKAETWQFRTRLAYSFETSFFNDRFRAEHTFSTGLQYTQDEVSFVNMQMDRDTVIAQIYSWDQRGANPQNNRFDGDPFVFRSSIFDSTPIRFDPTVGELAVIGRSSVVGMGDISRVDDYIKRSGWLDATLWYRGKYAVYHGRFLNDRLHIISGIRQDTYQVREKELIRIIDRDRVSDRWFGSGNDILTEYFAGYGDRPYEWNPNLPDSLNANVEENINRFRLDRPEGLITKNFERDENYNSGTFGINYTFTDALSGYYLYSQGIFPNSGQRDGANRPFTAERSNNNELGLKFEFFGGRISGRVAYWEIERNNAVWHWEGAPNTRSWWGAANQASEESAGAFSPRRVDLFLEDLANGVHRDENARNAEGYDIRYGVAVEYVREAFERLGMAFPDRGGRYSASEFSDFGVTVITSENARDDQYAQKQYTYFFANYHEMLAVDDETGGQNPIRLAFDLAMRDHENLQLGGFPIYYYGMSTPGGYGHNSSSGAGRGANVGFEEKGSGFDGQIFFTPISNYQMIFGFSYQQREVTSFTLVSGHLVDEFGNKSERQYTTEYDEWIFLLGAENFEDPRDPSTLKTGAIHGLDLSFVPRTHLSFWNKYTFVEGPLERLEIGGGVNYFSSVVTTTAINARNMQLDPFSTPSLPARFQFDGYLAYRFLLGRTQCRIALNVYNIFNDQEKVAYSEYEAEDGRTELRRSRRYYNPRSFRVNISFLF